MVAGLSAWHERHADAARAIADVSALPAHVMVEAYAVLTRLPAGLAVAAAPAADVLTRRFPDAPLRLSAGQQRTLIQRLADVGVLGGSSYDGIIALEAQAHEQTLMTLDRRAHETYLRLGVATRLVGASG